MWASSIGWQRRLTWHVQGSWQQLLTTRLRWGACGAYHPWCVHALAHVCFGTYTLWCNYTLTHELLWCICALARVQSPAEGLSCIGLRQRKGCECLLELAVEDLQQPRGALAILHRCIARADYVGVVYFWAIYLGYYWAGACYAGEAHP